MNAIVKKTVRKGYDTTAKGLVDASRMLISTRFAEKQADVLKQLLDDCVDIPLDLHQVKVGSIWQMGYF